MYIATYLEGKGSYMTNTWTGRRHKKHYRTVIGFFNLDGDFFSIMNVLMQLRKVCNHPDLFESRHIDSPFSMKIYIDYVVP